ncbi:hypothetical protein GR160_19140 [Flavobacterium sp. Sd200]|uniref:hypothetical protein n=1 Tax=Flavobacterium sp. Sd200 TaxID=2692211 RepID=UPI001368A2BC|nr:hypothetical protein [Flavobacterium sp. Sd200]MXN93344.1 hypothetical protein [Flavobacterium sp. Sd200]
MNTPSFTSKENMLYDTTVSHAKIIEWTKSKGGKPAVLKGYDGRKSDKLHINFLGFAEDDVQVSWDEFFTIFDKKNLEFTYMAETKESLENRFYKFGSSERLSD